MEYNLKQLSDEQLNRIIEAAQAELDERDRERKLIALAQIQNIARKAGLEVTAKPKGK